MVKKIFLYILLFLQFGSCSSSKNNINSGSRILNELYSKNHILELDGGDYFLNSNLLLKSNSKIIGLSNGSTNIINLNDYDIIIQDESNIILKDLTILNKTGHTSIKVFSGKGNSSEKDVRNIILSKISIDNTNVSVSRKHGIFVKSKGNMDIKNVEIESCKVIGSYGESFSKGYDNCYVGSYDSDGKGTIKNVRILNCYFDTAGRQNLSIAGKGKSKPSNILIKNCKLYNSSLAGIDLEEASDVIIEDCDFKNNGKLTKYFNLENKLYSMRSGLVAHRSNARVTNCNFTNCFLGYSSVNTHKGGISISNCTFKNSKVGSGKFAGMATTLFDNCKFEGDSELARIYNGGFIFDNCNFSGNGKELIYVDGGDLKRRNINNGEFISCSFTGNTTNSLIILGFENIKFTFCTFSNFDSFVSSTVRPNKSNILSIEKSIFTNVNYFGKFSNNSFEKIIISDSKFSNIKNTFMSGTGNNMEVKLIRNEFQCSKENVSFIDLHKAKDVFLESNQFTINSDVEWTLINSEYNNIKINLSKNSIKAKGRVKLSTNDRINNVSIEKNKILKRNE